jgi:hypothetical protein
MGSVIGRGRYGRVTYPETRLVSSSESHVGGTAQATVDGGNTADTNGNANQWRQVVGSDFAYAGTPDFTLTAASCVLTYNGVSGRRFLFLAAASFEGSATLNGTSGTAIAHNSDLVGGVMLSNASMAAGAGISDLQSNSAIDIPTQRSVVLNNGDTIRPVLGNFAGNQNLNIHSLSLSIIPQ